MRTKLIGPSISAAVVVAMAVLAIIVSLSTSGSAEDTYDERLDALETRVAILEAEVGISDGEAGQTSESRSSSQQNNVSVSSSQSSSSSSSNNGIYSGTFTSSGDNTFDVEIDDTGGYTLTVTTEGAIDVYLEDADGEPVPAFSISSEEGGALTTSGQLEAGMYSLRVEADTSWTATIMSSES